METLNESVMNLANSIIGASVLAMPYCFKQCGIILSVILLLLSSIVSRLTCHFLLKSAILSRRKTFELLAFHLFGGLGKLVVEIGMIGFLLGTCITYFVVMGDLGPVIIAEITKAHITSTMHTSILISLALFIILPLGLLRNVHSLTGVSKATMIFYCCLILKVIIEAVPHLFEENWYNKVNLWRPEGLLQCIPIFSMALFCQTQLFEIYEVVPNPTLDKMNSVIKAAVNFCTTVYICVGIFGYVAFANKNFTGNVLLSFEPSFVSHILKVGFIFSVAFSFPLVIFPCRASLYSLLYREGYTIHEGNLKYIPEGKFKALTFIIVFVSLVIAILIPNIELVLGLVGSTIGIMICVLFPVTCFICISHKNTNERIVAQIMLALGIFVMVVGTYKNIQKVDNVEASVVTARTLNNAEQNQDKFDTLMNKLPLTEKLEIRTELPIIVLTETNNLKEIRHEPPQPVEPIEETKKVDEPIIMKKVKTKETLQKVDEIDILQKVDKVDTLQKVDKIDTVQKVVVQKENMINDTVDIEAIKKEDKEEQLERKEIAKEEQSDEHKQLIDTIQKQNEVQKEIVEQQKQLLEVIKQQQQKKEEDQKIDEVKKEKMKAVKEIESIALKAIEKISEGEDSKKVVDDLKKGIEKNELKENKIESAPEKPKPKNDITQEENKKAKEFEKKVDNLKIEIQEFSSQLNQADIDVKKKETASEVKENNLPPEKNPIVSNTKDEIKENVVVLPKLDNPRPEVVLEENKATNSNKNGSLYLKVGNQEVKISDERDNSKLIPLPIAMSNNIILKKSDTKIDNSPLIKTEQEKNEQVKKIQAEEVQAMRREILSVSKEK